MRSHNLRASLASASGGGGGSGSSFSRGFYGGTGFTLNQLDSNYFSPGTWASSTKEEANAWILDYANNQSLWSMYYNSYFYQTLVTAKELTDASVPSGAKFNKLSSYVWGNAASNNANIPKGVRWHMHHTTDEGGVNNSGGYGPKSGSSRTLLYQDTASTIFPPMSTAIKTGSDNTIASMHLQGITTLNGATTAASGTGLLVEISAGGGDDSSASPASFFTWNGSDDVVVEISTSKASYYSNMFLGLVKSRSWKTDVHYRNDQRVDCHYGSSAWNAAAFGTINGSSMAGQMKMVNTNTIESDNWYDITHSDWTVYSSQLEPYNHKVVHSLKLDYTT